MSRIGILGGTFDPPHIGHLMIAEGVSSTLQLDEVWFIPTNEPPHKDQAVTSGRQRAEMASIAIADHPKFKVNTIELDREGKSYTFDTISLLQKQYPENEFYFIIGADMVEYLPHWHRIDELIEKIQFVGVKRPGYKLDTAYPIIEVDIPTINLSSTIIKERFEKNETVRYLIPQSVYRYIHKERLYENS